MPYRASRPVRQVSYLECVARTARIWTIGFRRKPSCSRPREMKAEIIGFYRVFCLLLLTSAAFNLFSGMSGPELALSDHQRLVDLWRGRLIEARTKYDQVVVVVQIQATSTDLTAGALPKPDESTKYILRAEAVALAEYMRILRIFTELVI